MIGDDNLENFEKWKDYDKIFENSNLVVAKRMYQESKIKEIVLKKYPNYEDKFELLRNPYYYISSTEIRQKSLK